MIQGFSAQVGLRFRAWPSVARRDLGGTRHGRGIDVIGVALTYQYEQLIRFEFLGLAQGRFLSPIPKQSAPTPRCCLTFPCRAPRSPSTARSHRGKVDRRWQTRTRIIRSRPWISRTPWPPWNSERWEDQYALENAVFEPPFPRRRRARRNRKHHGNRATGAVLLSHHRHFQIVLMIFDQIAAHVDRRAVQQAGEPERRRIPVPHRRSGVGAADHAAGQPQ